MTLHERITRDMQAAQKSKDDERAGVLRFVLAELHNREIEKRSAGKEPELNDTEVIETLRKEIKKRKEATELFRKGGREDLVGKEEKGLAILAEYVPPEMSSSEVAAVVDELLNKGAKDFGSLMKEAMARLKGRADGRLVAEIIKERLK